MPGRIRLKPLNQQVVLITGASSGIGLTTVRMAARRGARVVLVARSEAPLRQLEEEINRAGGQALAVTADVGSEADVRRAAEAAVTRFGGIDSWINDAGISIYGKLTQIPPDEHLRLFQTNFWGVVHGSLVAVGYLKGRGGGALINVGSTLSDRAIPIQGMYSASKHAVKGFTDALRMELEAENAPISVTLIKPGSINTPFPRHAKNHMGAEATLPPPVYAPDIVANAILNACEHPQRDIFIGGGGKAISSMGTIAPRLTDFFMEKALIRGQQKNAPPARRDALFGPSNDLSERGDYDGHTRETSAYTKAALHPLLTGGLLLAAGVAAAAALLSTRDD